ncbi:hypothetical protein H0H81_006408 [Sphagnurus paluster]|uniref:Uncharacterized protein n=1 Tax=Sphagnurus paluster TaxID=117069 RepID=A0A9P7K7H6_9AGAR|nr:hypothetical protein H0H81_006408 [Sphagnurus paluster]
MESQFKNDSLWDKTKSKFITKRAKRQEKYRLEKVLQEIVDQNTMSAEIQV